MIYGIGCDVVNIERIDEIIKIRGITFINRVFTKREIENAPSINQRLLSQYYAKRFAAKEAFSKAIGTGIGKVANFKDIEVSSKKNGMPYFSKQPDLNFNFQSHLSLSDDYPVAMAYVIIEMIK